MDTLKKVALHTFELFVVILVSFVIMKVFNLSGADIQTIISLAIGALAKFIRESEKIPVSDYVNK